MTLRLTNDDPRCRSQQRCAVSNWRKKDGLCNVCAREIKMERARAALERHKAKQMPIEFSNLYRILARKVGAKEAHRMVNIQIQRSLRSPVVKQPSNAAGIVP